MALLQNGFRDASAGVRIFGATVSNNAYPSALQGNNNKAGPRRNIFTAQGYSAKSGIASGHLHPSSWMLPQKPGGLSSHSESIGVASWSGGIAAGRNIFGTFDGAATFTGTGQLVVSGSGTFSGVAAFEGNIIAALAASGAFTGAATFSGAVVATGHMLGAFAGVASFEAIRYATGSVSGSFAPAITLEAQGFSSYLLDQEDVETGLTLRQALRLVTAATAGKISGGGTATITIRNAVADGVDRIVASVDTDGNRTAITYDLD
jgi:hypothetical protein